MKENSSSRFLGRGLLDMAVIFLLLLLLQLSFSSFRRQILCEFFGYWFFGVFTGHAGMVCRDRLLVACC